MSNPHSREEAAPPAAASPARPWTLLTVSGVILATVCASVAGIAAATDSGRNRTEAVNQSRTVGGPVTPGQTAPAQPTNSNTASTVTTSQQPDGSVLVVQTTRNPDGTVTTVTTRTDQNGTTTTTTTTNRPGPGSPGHPAPPPNSPPHTTHPTSPSQPTTTEEPTWTSTPIPSSSDTPTTTTGTPTPQTLPNNS